jgi:hypothetical protein
MERSTTGQITQGITYTINDNWQFNQSLFYIYQLDYGGHTVGLNFGAAYTIRYAN